MSDMPDAAWPEPVTLLEEIRTALRDTEASRRGGDSRDEAERRLRAAVEAARDAGVEWGRIAEALGTRRGNAYQRYRRRPGPAGTS